MSPKIWYIVINSILVTIMVVLPYAYACIRRCKYNLSSEHKWFVHPILDEVASDWELSPIVLIFTLFSVIAFIPILIGAIIFYIGKWGINKMSKHLLSDDERMQIAIGTKKETEHND